MTSLNESHRFWGALAISGGVVFVISLIMHPPIADPWDASDGLKQAAASTHWNQVHLLMSVGVIMWLGGLAGCTCMFQRNYHILRISVSLFIGSIAKWLVIASTEIGAVPTILARLAVREDYGLRSMGEVIFSSTLIATYSAMLLTWFSTALVTAYLIETGQKNYFPRWGHWASWLGVTGIVCILLFPVKPGAVALATSVPPFLWTLFYGWRFACRAREEMAK